VKDITVASKNALGSLEENKQKVGNPYSITGQNI
jgi:hypothetical protein